MKHSRILSTSLLLLGFALAAHPGRAQEKAAGDRTLKVSLHFTRAGTVDQKHKIYLFLFDSPEFMSGGNAEPIGAQNVDTKDATVTFPNIAKSPVYIIAVYDPAGAYEGMSLPPSGSSLGLYSKTPGQPEPIAVDAGKPAQITLAFDDSMKMP